LAKSKSVLGKQRSLGTFEMQGLKELEASLAELGKATARNVMTRALIKSAEPIKQAAISYAPRDQGNLAESITVSVKTAARSGKKAFSEAMKKGASRAEAGAAARTANKGAKGKDSFSQIFIGPTRDGYYGMFNEFGTKKMAAQPFMRPAFDAGANQALATIKDNLVIEIEKARQRAAKKALKKAKT
jgi:HK97 gp10 family phage protein